MRIRTHAAEESCLHVGGGYVGTEDRGAGWGEEGGPAYPSPPLPSPAAQQPQQEPLQPEERVLPASGGTPAGRRWWRGAKGGCGGGVVRTRHGPL